MNTPDGFYDDAYFASIVKELIKGLANDSELGSEVRSLYHKHITDAE